MSAMTSWASWLTPNSLGSNFFTGKSGHDLLELLNETRSTKCPMQIPSQVSEFSCQSLHLSSVATCPSSNECLAHATILISKIKKWAPWIPFKSPNTPRYSLFSQVSGWRVQFSSYLMHWNYWRPSLPSVWSYFPVWMEGLPPPMRFPSSLP